LVAAVVASTRLLPRGSLRFAPGLPAVIGLRGLLAAAFATAEVFLPLLLTRDLGWSIMEAGWALSTGAVFWSLGSTLQARLIQPTARQKGLLAGFLGVAVGVATVGLAVALHLHTALLFMGWALAGLGMGLSFPMLSVLTLKLSPPDEQGRNASALQLADALTTTAALALAGLVVAHAQGAAMVLGLAVLLATLGALGTGRVLR
jgi:MFS family permease